MADWVERDAARVWHGFPQRAAYAANSPVIVERAEGHELVDVDGRRYLDAISSLWVTTLGHRVPELDQALADQLGRVAHATLLGNGSRVVIELAEALTEVVPVDDPHFLFASDGAPAVEQALKIAFQYWANLGVAGRTTYLALGGAYHGDTVGSLSLGADGFGSSLFHPPPLPLLPAPRYGGPRAPRPPLRLRAVRASPRPPLPRQGDHGRLPPALGDGREPPRLRGLPRGGPRPAHLLPRPLLRRGGGGARARAPAGLLGGRTAPPPAAAEVRQRGLMCGVELVPGERHGRKV